MVPIWEEFSEILKLQEVLAPYTHLQLGGPAEALAQPRSVQELVRLVTRCHQEKVPHRILGGGSKVLVRDEGVRGVVIRLNAPVFTEITVQGNVVRAGAGTPLTGLISHAARQALAGLESLIGIPGTVGGALRTNASSKSGYISQTVQRMEALNPQGEIQVIERDDLDCSAPGSAWDDVTLIAAEFVLEPDNPDRILRRLRKFWIHKKAHQPLSFQAAVRMFKDPKGLAAEQLIEQAGLQGTRVGGVEVSERHANYLIAHPGATARDALRLIDLIRTRVAESFGQTLLLDIAVW